jgi:hypothetical protein
MFRPQKSRCQPRMPAVIEDILGQLVDLGAVVKSDDTADAQIWKPWYKRGSGQMIFM